MLLVNHLNSYYIDNTIMVVVLNISDVSHLTVLKERAYHVSEVCAEGASGLVILHHTVVVEDFSTAFTNRAKRVVDKG